MLNRGKKRKAVHSSPDISTKLPSKDIDICDKAPVSSSIVGKSGKNLGCSKKSETCGHVRSCRSHAHPEAANGNIRNASIPIRLLFGCRKRLEAEGARAEMRGGEWHSPRATAGRPYHPRIGVRGDGIGLHCKGTKHCPKQGTLFRKSSTKRPN